MKGILTEKLYLTDGVENILLLATLIACLCLIHSYISAEADLAETNPNDIVMNTALDINNLGSKNSAQLNSSISILTKGAVNNASKFNSFDNGNVTIKYPSSWKKQENPTSYTLVKFYAPSISNSHLATVAMNKHQLQTVVYEVDQMTFDVYSQAQLSYIKDRFNITNIFTTQISYSPAYGVVFNGSGRIFNMAWTSEGDSIYSVIYVATDETCILYLPIFEYMVNSIHITGSDKTGLDKLAEGARKALGGFYAHQLFGCSP